jgi:hypothetical protein
MLWRRWLMSPSTPGRIESPNKSSTRDTGQQPTDLETVPVFSRAPLFSAKFIRRQPRHQLAGQSLSCFGPF